MSHISDFFGRLHPMLVHLPIGILLLGILLLWLSKLKKIKVSKSVLSFTFTSGFVMAVFSCITGFLLSRSGEYNEDALSWHQWMGISVAVISFLVWVALRKEDKQRILARFFSILLFSFLIFAGHLGASLTHGADYLTEPLQKLQEEESQPLDLAKVNFDQAKFYTDLIDPILEKHCIACHGETKQKGNLRLDKPEFILKGGKSGKTVVAGRKEESELIYRIHSAIQDKKRMPPKEKRGLTSEEIQLLDLWVEIGADFEKKFSDLVSPEKRNSLLRRTELEQLIPTQDAAAPDEKTVDDLIKKGVSITKVSNESNYLSVSFISVPKQADVLLKELATINKNIVEIKLSGCEVDDKSIQILSLFQSLSQLSLEDTKISDVGLATITLIPNLVYLNLKGTNVTSSGIEKLKMLTHLRHLFLYQTKIEENKRNKIQSLFPETIIDFGGYNVPTLSSDTQQVKAAKH